MRRLILSLLVVALVMLAPAGCRRKKRTPVLSSKDGPFSVVNVADPAAAPQLLRGFHNVEFDAWRWTAHKFAVMLAPPATDAGKLELKFTIPEALFAKLGPTTVSATVSGVALSPETYSQAGDFTYTRDVPAKALSSGAVTVEFLVDKFLPPSEQDARELALIVSNISISPKQ